MNDTNDTGCCKELSPKGQRVRFGRLLLVVLLSFLAVSCGSQDEAGQQPDVVRPVKLMTVSSMANVDSQEFPGRVQASRRADLAFQVSGPLTAFPVEAGDVVKKGAVIAQILPRDFEIALQAARATELEARQQYTRIKGLYIKKQVSKSDFDSAKRAYDLAVTDVARAKNALQDTFLRAPFSGVIARRYVENYQEVHAKAPIVSLQDLSELEIAVDIPEAVVATLRDQPMGTEVARVAFSALPGVILDARLKEFSTEADPRTQSYRLALSFTAPEGVMVLPGMTAKVIGNANLYVNTQGFVMLVPVNAVFVDELNESCVWVVTSEMTVDKRKVTLGMISETSIRIVDGLEPGEQLVVAGVNYLHQGMKVRQLPST
ncbi:rnd efflux pump membrane fusion protein [Desulfoluna spongiiphila]|nr:rnd efflux pump membrane fusion protein [Desulfoluna spongiiphila]